MLAVDRANRILDQWDRASREERRALLPEVAGIPAAYIAVTTQTTGYPVVGFFPFGAADWPIEVAQEEGRKMGVPDNLFFANGRYHRTIEDAVKE